VGRPRDGAPDHADPQAVRAARLPGDRVVEVPDLEAAAVAPLHPRAIGPGVPVALRGEIERSLAFELRPAARAAADTAAREPAPAVVGEALGTVRGGDLAQDGGDVLAVVRSVDARDVELAVAEGLGLVAPREPVRMGLVALRPRPVRVHAREDRDTVLVRGLQELAEEVALAQELRAAVQRHPRGVVGHDAPRVDDDALGSRPL